MENMYFVNEDNTDLKLTNEEMEEGMEGLFEGQDESDEGTETLKDIDGKFYDEMFMEEFNRIHMNEVANGGHDFQEEEKDVDLNSCTIEQAVMDYKNGIPEAFEFIYHTYEPKLVRVGRRKNDDDLAQELSIVLLKAIETFDINGGAKFNTYYWKCARNHMGTLKIRQNAKKRTAEFGTISMQQPFSTKDSDVEMETFIEDKDSTKSYDSKIFDMVLEKQIYPFLKNDEITTIKMIMEGYTLEEIGKELGGITAPAVHVKLRRLASKKNVGKQLRSLYEAFGS